MHHPSKLLRIVMEEKDAFYVVRKGDLIGVYKTLSECQDQAGSSVCDPSMSVYKGYGMPIKAEKYLDLHGLKNAIYSINASHVKDDLFGKLVACPFQQPVSYKGKEPGEKSPLKRKVEAPRPINNFPPQGNSVGDSSKKRKLEDPRPISSSPQPIFVGGPTNIFQGNQFNSESFVEEQPISSTCNSCILEFIGASKGTPGRCGAGALLYATDGSARYKLREGVGYATKDVAEFRALILGFRTALKKGFTRICVLGESKLVRVQMLGFQKAKNKNVADLCEVADELRNKFNAWQIEQVLREFKSLADSEANFAIHLEDGEVEEIRM